MDSEKEFCDSLRDNSEKPYSKFDNTSQPILDVVRENILVCFNLITRSRVRYYLEGRQAQGMLLFRQAQDSRGKNCSETVHTKFLHAM